MSTILTIEIDRDGKKEFLIRFKAANGNILLTARGYNSKQSAKKSLDSVTKYIQFGWYVIEDKTKGKRKSEPSEPVPNLRGIVPAEQGGGE